MGSMYANWQWVKFNISMHIQIKLLLSVLNVSVSMKHCIVTISYLNIYHGFNPCILPLVSLLIDLGDQCHMSQLSTSDNVTTDSTPLNRCFSSPCQNGGECLENSMTSFCDCKNGEIIFVNSENYMSPDSKDMLLLHC